MPDTSKHRCVVVGGGPTGLTAALFAARRGWAVTLVESTGRLGGMAASIDVAGQRVDLGSHRLHPAASPASMALLTELLGNDLQTRRRNGRIRLQDRWLPFPLTPVAMTTNLALPTAAQAVADTLLSPFRRTRAAANQADDTFAEVIWAGLGPTVLEIFYGPYAKKLWGLEADQLAGELARRRVSITSPAALVRKFLAAKKNGPTPFLYPRFGYGQVVDELEAASREAGVEIVLNTLVTDLRPGSIELGDGTTMAADRVLWTAPPAALLHAAGQEPGAIEPRSRAMVLVFLVLDEDQYSEFDAHYFPETEVVMARLSEPKNYRDGDDPAGQTVLCAELACDLNDDVWNASDRRLADDVVASMGVAGLRQPNVVDVHVERLASVYPVMTPGNIGAFATVLNEASLIPGVSLLGRQGLLVADNLHHVIDMAIEAAACLGNDGGWDDKRWAEATKRFADNVVED